MNTVNAASHQPHSKKFGTIAAKISTSHERRMQHGFRTANGGVVNPGGKAYFRIEDITRHPEAASYVKWVCCHANCKDKTWDTKGALLAGHPDNRELARREETHLYYAVADMPEIPAIPEKMEKGRIVSAGVPAQPAQVMLLSDEE